VLKTRIAVRELLDPSHPMLRAYTHEDHDGYGGGTVYFITSQRDSEADSLIEIGDHIKIGWTKESSATSRLKGLQTGNPYQLEIVAEFGSWDKELENRLHKQFALERGIGEWFIASAALVDWFEEVLATNEAREEWTAEDRIARLLGDNRNWEYETSVEFAIERIGRDLSLDYLQEIADWHLLGDSHAYQAESVEQTVRRQLAERITPMWASQVNESQVRQVTVWAHQKHSHVVLPWYVLTGQSEYDLEIGLTERLLHCLSYVCEPMCRAQTELDSEGAQVIQVLHVDGCPAFEGDTK